MKRKPIDKYYVSRTVSCGMKSPKRYFFLFCYTCCYETKQMACLHWLSSNYLAISRDIGFRCVHFFFEKWRGNRFFGHRCKVTLVIIFNLGRHTKNKYECIIYFLYQITCLHVLNSKIEFFIIYFIIFTHRSSYHQVIEWW